MKNNYFEKAEKKYFSIAKKDEELKDKGIKENSFDNYKNSTVKYKKTADRKSVV